MQPQANDRLDEYGWELEDLAHGFKAKTEDHLEVPRIVVDDFEFSTFLGRGGHATVYRVRNRDKIEMALKEQERANLKDHLMRKINGFEMPPKTAVREIP